MMKFSGKLFFLISLLTHVGIFYSQSAPLDIVILLDDNNDYRQVKGRTAIAGPIERNLRFALELKYLKVPVLASSNLYVLLKDSVWSKEVYKRLLTNEWVLYKSTSEEFILTLPSKAAHKLDLSNPENLFSVGLNKEELSLISPAEFEKLLNDREAVFENRRKNANELIEPIDLNNLKKILVNPNARKRIFLQGHGMYPGQLLEGRVSPKTVESIKPMVAGLPLDTFKNFLVFLNSIGTDLLYVESCYAGGINLLQTYQAKEEESLKTVFPNYFLIIGSVTDEPAISSGQVDFGAFFDRADRFLTQSPKGSPSDVFKNMIVPIQPSNNKANIPSIRFPGKTNYFKAVDLNGKTEIITYATATARLLDLKAGKITAWPIKRKEVVLVYPIKIDVPVTIEDTIPSFISMIPGHSFHMFKGIQAPGTLNNVIEKLFLNPEVATEKLFLIEQLKTKSSNDIGITQNHYEFVVVQKGPEDSGARIFLQANNKFYKTIITYNRQSKQLEEIKYVEIEKKKALNGIKSILTNIEVVPQAIKQASGGQEDLEKLRKEAIKRFASE